MGSRIENFVEMSPQPVPIAGQESLCPAFGYSHSSTTMKVMKFAEYIPIIGMIVGIAHLVWCVKKCREQAIGTEEHITRALIAATNFGPLMIAVDLAKEILWSITEAKRLRSALDNQNIEFLRDRNATLARALSSFLRAEEQKNAPTIKLLQRRIRIHVQEILDLDKDVQQPTLQAEVLEIRKQAKAALQHVNQ